MPVSKYKIQQENTSWFYMVQAVTIHLLCYLIGFYYLGKSWEHSAGRFCVDALVFFGVSAVLAGLAFALAGLLADPDAKKRFVAAGEHCFHGGVVLLALIGMNAVRAMVQLDRSNPATFILPPLGLLAFVTGLFAVILVAIGVTKMARALAERMFKATGL